MLACLELESVSSTVLQLNQGEMQGNGGRGEGGQGCYACHELVIEWVGELTRIAPT